MEVLRLDGESIFIEEAKVRSFARDGNPEIVEVNKLRLYLLKFLRDSNRVFLCIMQMVN